MKLLLTCLFCLAGYINSSAQTNNSAYLFDNFKDAVVYYKDGRGFNVPLNYNLLTKQYIFIDKKDDNREKEFSDPQLIAAIEIEKRIFLPPSEGATEIIQAEPPFYVEYQGVSKRSGSSVGYGGTTETGSASSYSGIKGNSVIGGIGTANTTIKHIDKAYKIKIGKKMKTFFNKTKFLKLFPNKKEMLDEYIKKEKIDFDNIEQVLKLYNHALTLK